MRGEAAVARIFRELRTNAFIACRALGAAAAGMQVGRANGAGFDAHANSAWTRLRIFAFLKQGACRLPAEPLPPLHVSLSHRPSVVSHQAKRGDANCSTKDFVCLAPDQYISVVSAPF
jgi:hypothetical protein